MYNGFETWLNPTVHVYVQHGYAEISYWIPKKSDTCVVQHLFLIICGRAVSLSPSIILELLWMKIILRSPILKHKSSCSLKYIRLLSAFLVRLKVQNRIKNNRFIYSALVRQNTVADIGIKNEIPLGKSLKFWEAKIFLLQRIYLNCMT